MSGHPCGRCNGYANTNTGFCTTCYLKMIDEQNIEERAFVEKKQNDQIISLLKEILEKLSPTTEENHGNRT